MYTDPKVESKMTQLRATAHLGTMAALRASRKANRVPDSRELPESAIGAYHNSLTAEIYHNTKDDPEARYFQMLSHESAAKNHLRSAEYHRNARNELPHHSYSGWENHNLAEEFHNKAAKEHEQAANYAARTIGMDRATDMGLRDNIKDNYEDSSPRLIYADWLDEHGLHQAADRQRQRGLGNK